MAQYYDGRCNNILTAATLYSYKLMPNTDERKLIFAKMKVGSADLIYKLQCGYQDYQNGKSSMTYEKDLKGVDYEYLKAVYENILEKSQLLIELFTKTAIK